VFYSRVEVFELKILPLRFSENIFRKIQVGHEFGDGGGVGRGNLVGSVLREREDGRLISGDDWTPSLSFRNLVLFLNSSYLSESLRRPTTLNSSPSPSPLPVILFPFPPAPDMWML